MSLEELEDTAAETGASGTGDEPRERLNLQVDVASPSACQRHITVTVSREDVDRYFDKKYSELMETAAVPGFRAGRAPRKLVESRFRKDVAEQVKTLLLMDSMTQVNEDHKLAAISEPDFDPSAIEVPEAGPMKFEFDLEVRPDFDVPDWKGMTVERPNHEFTPDDVDRQLKRELQRLGRLVPHDGPAEAEDYVTVNITSTRDGATVARADEQSVAIRSTLSFRDGVVENFDQLMVGAKADDRRTARLKLSEDAANEELRGQEVELEFEVLDVKKFELPELSHEFLDRIGSFESEEQLREAVAASLKRQLEYAQQQSARQQITKSLTEAAAWELPPEMLKRQSERELHRSVLELRRSGFSEADIRAHENQLRQNSRAETARALREHFILERIAEEEKIDAEPSDYDEEVRLIAYQTGDSPRRVRAQLEKRGLMDSLHNQIIERKVIDLVLSKARFKDIPWKPQRGTVEAVDFAAGGGGAEIPEAEHAEATERPAEPKEHD